ncbi:MAG: DUF4249 domain-containing protein [Flavobacteriales bacterium]|nr:DUF4249 domain-containing protein [Flavobacteriales bacterium]
MRFFVIALILFVSCEKANDEQSLFVQAVLIEGEAVSGVQVAVISESGQVPVSGATVRLFNEAGESVQLSEATAGSYADLDGDFVISAGARYRLEVTYDSFFASAETVIPVQTSIDQLSSTTIPIDSGSSGQPIFSVLWSNEENLTHVLVLRVNEETPLEIPFDVNSGFFASQYAVPVTSNGVTLFDTDFTYYGNHTLEIYTIDAAYDALYFYQPGDAGNIIDGGPENIDGGVGYLTGACLNSIDLELLQ